MFVDFFGVVVVRANVCEEESIDNEKIDVSGIC